MDLDINSYTKNDLLNILDIQDIATHNITFEYLKQILFEKINNIKESKEELPDSKENLEAFFNHCFFKLVNELQLYETQEDKKEKIPEFISVQERLLPKLSETHVVEESGHAVAPHLNHNPVSTWNSHLRSGEINPLQRKSMKKILNINTRFRKNYKLTKSTDFIFEMPYPVKKVVSMKLVNTELPNTIYTFSSNLGSNSFIISNSNESMSSIIDISNGSYSITDLVDNINIAIHPYDVSLNYNDNTGKTTFTYMGTPDASFNLNFNYLNNRRCPEPNVNIDKNQLTLGWKLGFRGDALKKPKAIFREKTKCVNNKTTRTCFYDEAGNLDIRNVYTGKIKYESEGVFDGHGTRYILVSVDDFQNNHNEPYISPFQEQSLGDKNILAKVSTDCCQDGCCNEHVERLYFGPIDLTKLHIKLFDEYGRLIDINNADYSFTIELEVLYDL